MQCGEGVQSADPFGVCSESAVDPGALLDRRAPHIQALGGATSAVCHRPSIAAKQKGHRTGDGVLKGFKLTTANAKEVLGKCLILQDGRYVQLHPVITIAYKPNSNAAIAPPLTYSCML